MRARPAKGGYILSGVSISVRLRNALALAGVFCLLSAPPVPAVACSCMRASLSRRTVPADGASGFPTDGVIRVFLTAFPPAVRGALAAEYRLRDEAGQLVRLRSNVVNTRLDLIPVEALRPGSTYTLERVFAYASSGEQLSDSQRARAHADGVALRGAWFPELSFRTAQGPATPAQRAPVVIDPERAGGHSMRLNFAHGGGDCGPGISVFADVQLPADVAATDVLELQVQGRAGSVVVLDTSPAEGVTRAYAGNMMCNPDPVAVPDRGRLRLVLRDAAGAQLGASPWRPAIRPSGPVPRRPRGRPRPPAWLSAWSAIPVTSLRAVRSAGPSACPQGFEVVSRVEVAPHGAPTAYADRSQLTTDGRSGWITFRGAPADPVQLQRVRSDGSASPIDVSGVQANAEALLAAPLGPLLVSRTYGGGSSTATLIQWSPSGGAPRWTRPLPHVGGGYRTAHGGGRVLAAWGAVTPTYERLLSYGLFDERTGRSIAPLTHTAFGIDTGTTEAPAVACLDDRFVIAWTSVHSMRAGPVHTLVVHPDGSVEPRRILTLRGDGIPDLVSAGSVGGFVNASDGQIQFALLDRDGALERPPALVSGGVPGGNGRLPRVAYRGGVFAVAWETMPRGGVYVVAVDAQGHVSPALRMDRGLQSANAVGIAPSSDGFLASYTSGPSRGMLARLRCRAQPPGGAPARVDAL